MGLIYRYSHPFNCHGYVGKTERTIEARDKERFAPSADDDSKSLKDAMAKYGKENFRVEILQDGIMHPEILKLRERYWIRYFDDYYNGYNRTQGGDGVDSETARDEAKKRVADGTHPFSGDSNPTYKRIRNRTHNFQDSEFQRRIQYRRMANGTNPILDPQVRRKSHYAYKLNYKNQRREFYRWVSVILTAKSVCEERIYCKRTREGFFDKEIPDTSKSKQLDLFNH